MRKRGREADEGALSLRRPNGRTDAAAVVAAKQSKGEGSAEEVIDRRPNSISNINIGNEGGSETGGTPSFIKINLILGVMRTDF